MRTIRTSGCSMLLAALFISAFISNISPAIGECASCMEVSISSEQDDLKRELTALLGEESASFVLPGRSSGLVKVQSNPTLSQQEVSSRFGDESDQSHNPAAWNEGNDMGRGSGFSSVLIPPEGVNLSDRSNTIIDISPRSTEYIPGAISIPYDCFIDPAGRLEPVNEMARVLGEAGISENDSLIIYGECQPCGGGPSAATYVYWILKYLGHKDVRLLDGGIDDWVAASNPTSAEPAHLPPRNYTPTVDADLLATHEFLHNSMPQIIDARTRKEFEARSIPGAVNIPYDSILDGKRIKSESELSELFSYLQKYRPVVVYTNTGVKASMIWLPLQLLGYEAKIYSWQDWETGQTKLSLDLLEAKADPNPAPFGGDVNITVLIEMGEVSGQSVGGNRSDSKIKSASGEHIGGDDGLLYLRALIRNESGNRITRVLLDQVSDDEFAGVWNATVPGTYDVGIIATKDGSNKIFLHALQIEVVETSK